MVLKILFIAAKMRCPALERSSTIRIRLQDMKQLGQAAVTRDVAGNVAKASAGLDSVAADIRSGGERILGSATELSELAEAAVLR